MAEAARVTHAFTFPSYEANKIGQVDELQESVSFGRFATESLAWDRWSSFTNKHYVEEAAKHSQPGLVASKKAFFEAYYKKKTLLEKENADGNYAQELDAEDGNLNFTYPSSETVVSDLQGMDHEQARVETLETDSTPHEKDKEKTNIQVYVEIMPESEPLDAMHNKASENEAILKEVKTNQEVTEVNDGEMFPTSPPPPPSVLQASSKRVYTVNRPRVSFSPSTDNIIPIQLPVQIVSGTAGFPTSKACLMLEPSASACTRATRTKALLNSPATKSRRSRTDHLQYSESTKASPESKSPIISSPFGFGTRKGNDKSREKLEEILNNKASKKVQFHIKMQEKAASHLKKLRIGCWFSSKPSPDLQHQSQAKKIQSKINVTSIQLEKHRNSTKNGCWRHVEKQRSQRQIRPGSLGEAIAHKGKSHIAQIL